MTRRNLKLILFAVTIIPLPLILVAFARYVEWIDFTSSWKNAIIVTLIVGWPPALWYLADWLQKLFTQKERQPSPEFPYKSLLPKDLASNLTTLSRHNIPYVPRLSSPDFEQMLKVMSDAQYLLIIGRTGLGKTREAVELIQRIEAESGEEVTVLVPDGVLDVPLRISGEKLNRKVILFIDDLPARYAEPHRVTDLNDPRSIADDFRERFEQTLRLFRDYYGSKFNVIATAIGEPDLRERLRLGEPFWKQFTIYELPDLAEERRPEFLQVLERTLDVEITREAKILLTERSDGTYSGLIVPLVRERSKRLIEVNDAKLYRCIYPQDWEQRVYKPVFAGNKYRRSLLAALSIVREAQLVPSEFLVIELAARLGSNEILFWHRWRLKHELRKLSDWIELSEGVLSCPEAYIANKGDLLSSQEQLLQSVFHLIGRKAYLYSLRSSLYQLLKVLQYKLDDPRSALTINKRFIDIDPGNGRAWSRLALIYFQLVDYEQAERACLESIRLSDHSNAWSILATIYSATGKNQKAIKACHSAIEKDPKRAFFWTYLGMLLSKTGDLDGAIEAGQKAVELDRFNAFAHISLSISYDKAGLIEKAIETCNRAIMLDARSATAWQTLGVTYSKAKQFGKAVEACSKATELEPSSAIAWGLLARALEVGNRLDEAIVAQERAVNLEPQEARNWLSLGVALDLAGYSQQAFEVLKEATDLDAELIPAWQALARTAGALGHTDIVFSALTKVTDLAPSSAQDWFVLGIAYCRHRLYPAAVSALSKATELRPDKVKAWKALFTTRNKLHDFPGALDAIQRLSGLEPDNSIYMCQLGIAYGKVNQYDKAIETLQKTVDMAPQLTVAWQALRRIYLRTKQSERVLAVSLKLVELEPKNAYSWSVLGITYKNSGDNP
jgi:tetratricopeptide (TPR) repeat protein